MTRQEEDGGEADLDLSCTKEACSLSLKSPNSFGSPSLSMIVSELAVRAKLGKKRQYTLHKPKKLQVRIGPGAFITEMASNVRLATESFPG